MLALDVLQAQGQPHRHDHQTRGGTSSTVLNLLHTGTGGGATAARAIRRALQRHLRQSQRDN